MSEAEDITSRSMPLSALLSETYLQVKFEKYSCQERSLKNILKINMARVVLYSGRRRQDGYCTFNAHRIRCGLLRHMILL